MPPTTIEEFEREALEEARREAKRKRKPGGPVQNLRPQRAGEKSKAHPDNRPEERICQHVFSARSQRSGRCKQWTVPGAPYCVYHGGLRWRPDHPAVHKRLGAVQAMAASRRADKAIRAGRDGERGEEWRRAERAARRALRAEGLNTSPPVVLEGIKAMLADDTGTSWARWIRSVVSQAAQERERRLSIEARRDSA